MSDRERRALVAAIAVIVGLVAGLTLTAALHSLSGTHQLIGLKGPPFFRGCEIVCLGAILTAIGFDHILVGVVDRLAPPSKETSGDPHHDGNATLKILLKMFIASAVICLAAEVIDRSFRIVEHRLGVTPESPLDVIAPEH